jgi:hypothetical protein
LAALTPENRPVHATIALPGCINGCRIINGHHKKPLNASSAGVCNRLVVTVLIRCCSEIGFEVVFGCFVTRKSTGARNNCASRLHQWVQDHQWAS